MESVAKSTGVFKDNVSLCDCIANQYNLFVGESLLFERLKYNQGRLSNAQQNCSDDKESSKCGCISTLIFFIVFILFLKCLCNLINFMRSEHNVLLLLISIIMFMISILIPIIYFKIYKPRQRKNEKQQIEYFNQEVNGICDQLWQVYNLKGYKCIPFEYSDPQMLEQLYGIAKKFNLVSVSDTINTYYRVRHIENMDELNAKNYEVQKCCYQTMRNYAVMKVLGPRRVNVNVHY